VSNITFSIIQPLYKQADQIDRLVTDYVTALSSQPETRELIPVVNGEDDLSFSQAKKYSLTDNKTISVKVFKMVWEGQFVAEWRILREPFAATPMQQESNSRI